MKFSTFTLGCKVNQFETGAIENILISHGHEHLKAGDGCDVCIINTCTVTATSAGKSRKAIRQLKQLEPNALIAVCGCLSQLEPESIVSMGVDIVGGSGDRHEFVKLLELYFDEKQRDLFPLVALDEPNRRKIYEDLPCGFAKNTGKRTTQSRTRALLKIQDGCNNYCTYCIIPYARGHSRSLPLSKIGEQARYLKNLGYREIVITGIEISSYGEDLTGSTALIDALYEVDKAAPDVRIRLGSLDPGKITGGFISGISAIKNLCDHYHLSVQSGCDETLHRMGRKYSASGMLDAIYALRATFPNCGITTDLLVGLPGESDEEFEKTLHFIKKAAFSDMHVFPYSARPQTKAAKMPNQVPGSVKKSRARLASRIALEMSLNFKRSQIGRTVDVLFERKRNGLWNGYSTNYIEVSVKSEARNLRNCVKQVKIMAVEDGKVVGRV